MVHRVPQLIDCRNGGLAGDDLIVVRGSRDVTATIGGADAVVESIRDIEIIAAVVVLGRRPFVVVQRRRSRGNTKAS